MFLTALALATLDLLIKQSVEEKVKRGEELEKCQGRLLVRNVRNKGMMLNLGDSHPEIVRAVSAVLGVILSGYYVFLLLFRKGQYLKKLGMTLLTGGALSNIYDRLVRHYVIDYLGFRTRWRKFTNVTFNLGDFFIFLGTILTFVGSLFRKR